MVPVRYSEDVGELDSAWNRLENARKRLNEVMARR